MSTYKNSKQFCYYCGGPLTQKFFEERDRLYCLQCDRPIYENPIPATAAVVMNEKNQVLLARRTVEPKAGQWCLPGGFLEMGESPECGCLRELKEETNLEGDIGRWAGNVLSESPVYRWVLVLGYTIKNARGELRAGDDCDRAEFFDTRTMPPIAFRSHRRILANALEAGKHLEGCPSHPIDLKDPGCFGAYVITSGDHVEMARRACSAGARVLQYRDKQVDRGEMYRVCREIREITRASGTVFIVNDYIDLALMVGADGVHLGQDDIPIEAARKLTPPGFIIGLSTHSLEQALEAERRGADYIGSGPVFATPTKETYIPIGIEVVKQVLRTVRIPVVAIGGLTPQNILRLREVGACNFAMVRAYQENTEAVIAEINCNASGEKS